jgi:hypothetical protein
VQTPTRKIPFQGSQHCRGKSRYIQEGRLKLDPSANPEPITYEHFMTVDAAEKAKKFVDKK